MAGSQVRESELSSRITELSLRKTALNLASNKISYDAAGEFALSHIERLSHGAGDVKKQLSGMGLQQEIIGVAVAGITLAVSASLAQLETLGHARLDLDKEFKAGNATFLVPTNTVTDDLAQLQAGMDSYLDLCQTHSKIFPYLSLRVDHVEQGSLKIAGDLISTIPFYKMSNETSQAVSSNSLIDKNSQLISLFLKYRMDTFLKKIKDKFRKSFKVVDFFDSTWQGDNFLNNYRGPRLIMMSLANLLWNLQHPTDVETGLELSLEEKIELCKHAATFIGALLNVEEAPNIDALDPTGNLGTFVRKIEFYIKGMLNAYELEQNKSLTLESVCNYAHRAAIILNENIFYIIYKKEQQSETLASIIGDLNLLLEIDDELLTVLRAFRSEHPLKNDTETTVIDVLLIYCQLDTKQKAAFEQVLRLGHLSVRESFADGLKDLDTLFIRPIYEAQKKDLRKNEKKQFKYDLFGSKLKEKARRRALLQFMPLVGLAVNDNPVPIDTGKSIAASVTARLQGKKFLTSRQQINEITDIAARNVNFNKDAFVWDLSAYLSLNEITKYYLNQMCFKQYKIGQVTNLIKSIKNFINKYHSYLLQPQVKEFIFRCFAAIGGKFEEVQELCAKLIIEINPTKINDRSLINQIKNMDESLSTEISSFMVEVKKNQQKLDSEHFAENVKNEIMSNLRKINEKFGRVFGREDTELNQFIDIESSSNLPSRASAPLNLPDNRTDVSDSASVCVPLANITKERSKLSSLMLECYQQMSFLSQNGVKGKKLMALHKQMISREACTIADLKLDAEELAKIVCAYRPTFFFQAEYAHTRSSEALIKAIIASVNDKDFPLYDWLFGEESILDKSSGFHTKNVIADKLNSAKTDLLWPLSTEQFERSEDKPLLNVLVVS